MIFSNNFSPEFGSLARASHRKAFSFSLERNLSKSIKKYVFGKLLLQPMLTISSSSASQPPSSSSSSSASASRTLSICRCSFLMASSYFVFDSTERYALQRGHFNRFNLPLSCNGQPANVGAHTVHRLHTKMMCRRFGSIHFSAQTNRC